MQSANLPPKSTRSVGGLSKGPAAYFFDQLLDAPRKRAFLLCADELEADRWETDLNFFLSFRAEEWRKTKLLRLSCWEHSPYRSLQPGIASRLQRIQTLQSVVSSGPDDEWIVIGSLPSAMQRAPQLSHLTSSLKVSIGLTLTPEEIESSLIRLGYTRAESVEDPGSFAIRGGLVDVFSPALENPARIEFFDDIVESIRIFNPETQRSIRVLASGDSVTIIPTREFPCDSENLFSARERLKDWCESTGLPRSSRERVSSLLAQGIVTPEMDYLLSFFQAEPTYVSDLFRGVGAKLVIAEPEELESYYEKWVGNELKLFESSKERMQPIPEPATMFGTYADIRSSGSWKETIEIRQIALKGQESRNSHKISLPKPAGRAESESLRKLFEENREKSQKLVVVANSQAQLDRIAFLLAQQKIQSIQVQRQSDLPNNHELVFLSVGVLSESFAVPENGIVFLSEDAIFGEKKHAPKSKKKRQTPPIVMDDLLAGDLVVHSEHGIGKYVGLQKIKALDSEGDFAAIEYADGDKLYVPVYRLENISRYVGNSESPSAPLDKLGSGSFAKTKERVKAAVKEIAQDLLRVHAERTTREGFSFSPPDDQFREFEAEFPYDETPDQERAIAETIQDMCESRPMDRLICGDVGFGKTEVAIRAAFKAVQDGKQVAVLVPTTILAEQHHATFSQRMKNLPVKIASISRFRSRKEQSEILANLTEGKIDIIIGTHRLLSKDVRFRDLGLVIIDEEQRFGVEHKEKLKQIRVNTDILTLTATPIPRTLQMSLMGLKDVSIIRTPPTDRMSIKTYLSTFDENVIQDAIENELGRGGQVFFIHNRIYDIHQVGELVEKLVPKAKVAVAHGQMPESQLERAMIGFYNRDFNVLVATAIIENGLDVPNANTLIVNRADTFGLSQLYQIRGRVGRSQTRAFCYFLIPSSGAITQEAKERLSVLQRFVELGSGYNIATHDLEIRGGGDVLGQAQSGHIASVGYEMYLELLQDEIHRAKGEKVSKALDDVEITVPFPALLPNEYVPDMKSRMALYRRLSLVSSEEDCEDAKAELTDRYGPLPDETVTLLGVVRLKLLMRRMGLKSLTLGPKGISIAPGKDPVLEPGTILMLVQSRPREYSILPEGKFVIHGRFSSTDEIHNVLRQLLQNAMQ